MMINFTSCRIGEDTLDLFYISPKITTQKHREALSIVWR